MTEREQLIAEIDDFMTTGFDGVAVIPVGFLRRCRAALEATPVPRPSYQDDKASAAAAVRSLLDEPLNSGDGVYRP